MDQGIIQKVLVALLVAVSVTAVQRTDMEASRKELPAPKLFELLGEIGWKYQTESDKERERNWKRVTKRKFKV